MEDMDLYFPYEYMYPEQYDYMLSIKHALDAKVLLAASETAVNCVWRTVLCMLITALVHCAL